MSLLASGMRAQAAGGFTGYCQKTFAIPWEVHISANSHIIKLFQYCDTYTSIAFRQILQEFLVPAQGPIGRASRTGQLERQAHLLAKLTLIPIEMQQRQTMQILARVHYLLSCLSLSWQHFKNPLINWTQIHDGRFPPDTNTVL